MKFLHSPSSTSSSSSSTTNYTATARCFPALLRRLLCFRTLPALSFDHHITNSYGNNEFDGIYCGNNKLKGGNPGIVAKLMGLDSMPEAIEEGQGSSCCVNEAPSFIELENEKFIILSFEGGGKDKELGLKSSKTTKGLIEFDEKRKNKKKKKNQEIPICKSLENDGKKVMNSCKLFDFNNNSEKRRRSRKKRLEEVDTDSDSENSSPVSVLEFSDHQETLHLGKEDLKPKNSNLRRELRADLEKNTASSSSSSSSSSMDDNGVESSKDGKKYVGLKNHHHHHHHNHHDVIKEFGEMWEEICKVAKRDVMDSRRERWKGEEDFEEIVVNFELQILDQLILELFTIT